MTMKKLVSMLLASVMTFSTFGMVAFADDGQQAAPARSKAVATQSSRNIRDLVYLKKTSYAWYNKVVDGEYNPTRVEDVFNNIAYTSAGKDADFDIYAYATTMIRTSNGKTIKGDDTILTPGKYSLVVKADAPYTGTAELSFEVLPLKVTAKNSYIETYSDTYRYSGKKICPKFTYVDVDFGDSLKSGRDYIITNYKYKNNKSYGTATMTATITFKGNYTGTFNLKTKFTIAPQRVMLKHAKVGKKSVKVKWSKSKDASGYKISVYTSNGKLVKSRVIKGKKKTTCTIKGLKRHKNYDLVVASYRKVKGKKVYGFYGKDQERTFRTK